MRGHVGAAATMLLAAAATTLLLAATFTHGSPVSPLSPAKSSKLSTPSTSSPPAVLTTSDLRLCVPEIVPCTVRTYYIAADEVEWDYAPTGMDNFAMLPLDESPLSAPFTRQEIPGRIGRKYIKAIYQEYEDATFTKRKPKEDPSLGIVGPILRAEVGDTLRVVFKNNARFNFSLHPHAALYDKNSEGAVGGSINGRGASVAPGETFTYRWFVPDRAGPGPLDLDSNVWAYHSHVSDNDIYAGLYGALVIYKNRGVLDHRNKPRFNSVLFPVQREIVTYWVIMDETLSPYLSLNVERYAGNSTLTVDEQRIAASLSRATGGVVGGPNGANTSTLNELGGRYGGFQESNRKHPVNGYGWGNLPGLDFAQSEYVRWYSLGLGSFLDLHVLHWHGITGIMEGHRRDTIELFPATFHTLDARMDDPGQWMMHCHINEHFEDGMLAFFRVHTSAHAGANGHGWAPANFSNVPAPKALGPVPEEKLIAEQSNIHVADNAMTSSTPAIPGNIKTSVWFGKPLPPPLKIGVTKLKDPAPRGSVGKQARHA